MKLIKDNQFVKNDWHKIDPSAPLDKKACLISLTRLKQEKDILKNLLKEQNIKLGVILTAGQKTDEGDEARDLLPYLNMLSLIAIEFPVFRNGRGFTTARLLREELGYQGEIRAIGEVLYDQWHFMKRCGINSFEVKDEVSLKDFKTALKEFSYAYQPATDSIKGILWQRNKNNNNETSSMKKPSQKK